LSMQSSTVTRAMCTPAKVVCGDYALGIVLYPPNASMNLLS
jgi:hypothetical protein